MFADELVRDACELAVAVAQTMEARDVPPPLRRYLRMQRLPGASALSAIRRVLDSDDDFRATVAAAASEGAIDRPSWLFVTRPDGWADELVSVAESTASASVDAQRDRDERAAQRKLASVEAKLRDALSSMRDASSRADAEHAARVAADASVRSLSERIDALRHERDDVRRRLALAESRPAVPEAPPATVPAPAAPSVDVDAIADALDRANAAIDALRESLASVQAALRPDTTAAAEEGAPPPAVPPPSSPPARPRRRPLRLPGGMLDDSVDAADWLVRRPGAIVLVDGYNCTLRDTPIATLPIPEQRRRLVDALTELASRTHADVEVVFDGADVDQPLSTGRRGVRVTFSAPGTEADDVVIARSAALPLDRPVVVASSDNRVRAGAADNGANVISAEQLMAVVRARR